MIAFLAERFGWTVDEILDLSLIQIQELTEAANSLDEKRNEQRKRAARKHRAR